jgi:Tfp pilus assembly pilus retraction ATPase PilT
MDIAELLTFSVKNGASDLHLSAGLPPMIRVDGDMRTRRWNTKRCMGLSTTS